MKPGTSLSRGCNHKPVVRCDSTVYGLRAARLHPRDAGGGLPPGRCPFARYWRRPALRPWRTMSDERAIQSWKLLQTN